MRAFVLSLAAVFVLGTIAMAQDAPKTAPDAAKAAPTAKANPMAKLHPKAEKGSRHIMNNVVKMSADGKMTALCCCGKEFTVTDNSPTIQHNGTTFYLCGDGCKQMADKSTPKQTEQTMAVWHTKYKAEKLASNMVMKNGKRTATCLCGKTIDVTKGTESISENGVTIYVCSDACASTLHNMSAADRLAKEKEIAANVAPAAPPATPAK